MLNIFRKKDKKKNIQENYYKLRLLEIIRETEDATTLVFEKPEDGFDYLPGQYLTLLVPMEEEPVRRAYSMSSSPHLDSNIAITVKRVDEGVVSNYLNENMKVGEMYEVMKPMGSFTPDIHAGNEKQYVMIAGGSGITPMISIIQSILKVEPSSQLLLIYQNRNEHSIIFRSKLNDLRQQYPDRLKLIHVLSRPGEDWDGLAGRLDSAQFKSIMADQLSDSIQNAEYFVCGPSGLMQTVESTLSDIGVAKSNIHKESFVAVKSDNSDKKEEDSVSAVVERKVNIILDGEKHDIIVPPQKSILEAALDHNIDMPFSCQSGLCTACRGKLLSGEVYMEEDEGLSDEEIEEGYVLNCVGHPRTDKVVIEIG
jgi:ring-1,2-phenylacetyl-CoA epoxidase subunit PaaE